jgi:hypothetical protein
MFPYLESIVFTSALMLQFKIVNLSTDVVGAFESFKAERETDHQNT